MRRRRCGVCISYGLNLVREGGADAMVRAIDQTGRLMAGERDFESFCAASYRRLVVQLLGVTGNLHDAEDIVQEAFAPGGGLPRRYREVLVLHYLADLPVQEVAAELRVPVGTVSSRLARGRAALVRALDDGEEASHARR
jgi:DNA-directed RNA polymerase specialized sigma24 family protein